MDARRATFCYLVFAFTLAFSAPLQAAEAPRKLALKSRRPVGDLARVEATLQVGGDLKLVTDGKPIVLPMSVVGQLHYDERVLALDGDGRAARSVRYYDDAQAIIKVAKGGERPMLRDEQHLVIVEKPAKTSAMLFCPTSPLKREELDLIDVPGNTLLVDRLLPADPVATNDTWKLSDQTLTDLLSLEAVSWSDVRCVLGEATGDQVEIAAAGSLSGAVGGVSTEIELKAKYRFDLKRRQINFLALLIKEKRAVGHVGPGLDTVAKVVIQITPIGESKHLDAKTLSKVPKAITPEFSNLTYISPGGEFRLQCDRRWYLTSDDSKMAVWRMLDRGELVAQCNMSVVPGDTKKPASLAEFQKDIQESLGKNFGQFTSASQSTSEAGYTVLRVVVHGVISQLPIEWVYYLIAEENGQRVSLAFTYERSLEDRFAHADQTLVRQVRLTNPQRAAAAKPTAARQLK